MNEVRRTYLRAAGLIAIDKRDARKAALERAHDIRKFEIELYWKRATYFWVLQAAVFTAFGLIWKDSEAAKWGLIPVALSCLGLLTAMSGWLSSLGSKFWQANWEQHIDMLEDEFEGRLHKTAWIGPKGVRWSVSGVNERMSFFFVAFWVIAVCIAVHRRLSGQALGSLTLVGVDIDWEKTALLGLLVSTAVGVLWLWLRTSNLKGELINLEPDAPAQTTHRLHRLLCFFAGKNKCFFAGKNKLKLLRRPDVK